MGTVPAEITRQLMAAIRRDYKDAIETACAGTQIRPGFLAALIANESGGAAGTTRFEPSVYFRLADVIMGRQQRFEVHGIHHPITSEELLAFIEPDHWPEDSQPFTAMLLRLNFLATSYGLTQIMGWHFVEFGWDESKGADIGFHLARTVELLSWFAELYKFDPAQQFESLFRCWNTGMPTGKTFDPDYVTNGLNRMAAWNDLEEAESSPQSGVES